MNRFTPFAVIGVSILSLGTVALAQTPAPPSQPRNEARQPLDRAALQGRLAAAFDAADKNRDGVLSVEERQAQRSEARDKMRQRTFARLDANKDGSISKDEFMAVRKGPRDARPEGARERRPERSSEFRGGGHGLGGGMMMGRQLAEFRGKPIPRADFINAGLAPFDRIDTNRDGKISAEERTSARKSMMEQRKPDSRRTPAT
jgi:Ca2+-binding EF-hand superfamily protein